jgi:hypothetical protein
MATLKLIETGDDVPMADPFTRPPSPWMQLHGQASTSGQHGSALSAVCRCWRHIGSAPAPRPFPLPLPPPHTHPVPTHTHTHPSGCAAMTPYQRAITLASCEAASSAVLRQSCKACVEAARSQQVCRRCWQRLGALMTRAACVAAEWWLGTLLAGWLRWLLQPSDSINTGCLSACLPPPLPCPDLAAHRTPPGA